MAIDEKYKKSSEANKGKVANVGGVSVVTSPNIQKKPGSNIQYYSDPNRVYSSDPLIASGQRIGEAEGEALYGQSQEQTGEEIADIIKKRRAALDQKDPVSDQIRQSKNVQLRQLRESQGRMGITGGTAAAQESQVERQAQAQIGSQLYQANRQDLSQYQRLLGNIASNQASLEMGYAGLEKSGEYVPTPGVGGGFMGTVICTELFNQGLLDESTWIHDKAYGKHIIKNDPYVYIGYYFWAKHVARMMRRSKLITYLIYPFAKCWAKDMAYNKSFVGKCINRIGQPICAIIGKILVNIGKGVIHESKSL
jgi:hypothetical protein